MNARRCIIIASVIGLALVGCAPTDDAPSVGKTNKVDTTIFDKIGSFDYFPYESPEKLAASPLTTAVLAGEVQGFEKGRTKVSPGVEQHHVVMRVAVREALKGQTWPSGFAYVELRQGALCPNNEPCLSVEKFQKAIPVGTKVLVLGRDVTRSGMSGGRVLNNEAGRPPGSHLVSPAPQGLLFEETTDGVPSVVAGIEPMDHRGDGWKVDPSKGIQGMVDRLRAAGFKR